MGSEHLGDVEVVLYLLGYWHDDAGMRGPRRPRDILGENCAGYDLAGVNREDYPTPPVLGGYDLGAGVVEVDAGEGVFGVSVGHDGDLEPPTSCLLQLLSKLRRVLAPDLQQDHLLGSADDLLQAREGLLTPLYVPDSVLFGGVLPRGPPFQALLCRRQDGVCLSAACLHQLARRQGSVSGSWFSTCSVRWPSSSGT